MLRTLEGGTVLGTTARAFTGSASVLPLDSGLDSLTGAHIKLCLTRPISVPSPSPQHCQLLQHLPGSPTSPSSSPTKHSDCKNSQLSIRRLSYPSSSTAGFPTVGHWEESCTFSRARTQEKQTLTAEIALRRKSRTKCLSLPLTPSEPGGTSTAMSQESFLIGAKHKNGSEWGLALYCCQAPAIN